jgi:hypothetical protein
MSIPVAARFERSVCGHSLARTGGFEFLRRMVVCLLWVFCCQLELCATGWSFIQRSPTKCDVPECDLENSARRPTPTSAVKTGTISQYSKWRKNRSACSFIAFTQHFQISVWRLMLPPSAIWRIHPSDQRFSNFRFSRHTWDIPFCRNALKLENRTNTLPPKTFFWLRCILVTWGAGGTHHTSVLTFKHCVPLRHKRLHLGLAVCSQVVTVCFTSEYARNRLLCTYSYVVQRHVNQSARSRQFDLRLVMARRLGGFVPVFLQSCSHALWFLSRKPFKKHLGGKVCVTRRCEASCLLTTNLGCALVPQKKKCLNVNGNNVEVLRILSANNIPLTHRSYSKVLVIRVLFNTLF